MAFSSTELRHYKVANDTLPSELLAIVDDALYNPLELVAIELRERFRFGSQYQSNRIGVAVHGCVLDIFDRVCKLHGQVFFGKYADDPTYVYCRNIVSEPIESNLLCRIKFLLQQYSFDNKRVLCHMMK